MRLDLAYDGTAFSGWAAQPGRRTVEGVLSDALATALGQAVTLVVAGRTDAGVHATGQVAHLDVDEELSRVPDLERLLRRVNGLLPPDVRVRDVAQVPVQFDARFAALSRSYVYRIADRPTGLDPLRRHDTLAVRHPLDAELMARAAEPLVGLHDFVAYCRPRPGATTVREVLELRVVRQDAGLLTVALAADAFCHHMVRAVVGALRAVGEGRRPVTWPHEVLLAKARDPAVGVSPPHGLTLVAVAYPAEEDLTRRTAEARAMRGEPHRARPAARRPDVLPEAR